MGEGRLAVLPTPRWWARTTPSSGRVRLGSRDSQGGLGGRGMGQGQVLCAPTLASPSRAPGSLQAGLAAAGLAWEGLRKELELPRTPLLGHLSLRCAEGSGRCVWQGSGGRPVPSSQSLAPVVTAVGRWAGNRCGLALNPWYWTLRWRQLLSHNSLADWCHTPSKPSKCRILKI